MSSNLSNDWQEVSETAHSVKGSFITSFPLTNSKWVLTCFVKGSLITSFLWPTVCEWKCKCCEGSLIMSFPMINREWAPLHILWKAVLSYPLLWPTVCEWHCTFVKGSLITSFPMTNSKFAHFLTCISNPVSSYFFLLPTESEWHCTFCERQSHHIFFFDQQGVSDIPHFLKGILVTSFPITNSKWVTLHILCKAFSSLSPTASECYCTFSARQSHTPFPITNREWVMLHIL